MAGDPQPVRIAVNVMRARLTVVGFNLTIVALQLGALPRLPGSVALPNVDLSIHVESAMSLFTALAVSVLAMIAFIASSAFDRDGTCDHASLLAGDLLMYLGLAHSVAGIFAPFVQTLDEVGHGFEGLNTVRMAVAVVGAVAWFAATYVGPAVSLLRSPFGRRVTIALGDGYLVAMLLLAYAGSQAVRFELARGTEFDKAPPTLLNGLIQPLRW